MKEKFINSSLAFIMKYQECDDLKIKRLKYGLEGIYSTIVKLMVVLIIACITQTIKTTLLFVLFYAGIRTFSFGWHAKSNIACWISSITIYNIIPLLISHLTLPNYIGYFIIGIALISMILWAPADTPRRPLIRKNQRIKAKVISLSITILYLILYSLIDISLVKNALLYALLVQTILINPLTYKITNTQFNNYKYYKKKVE